MSRDLPSRRGPAAVLAVVFAVMLAGAGALAAQVAPELAVRIKAEGLERSRVMHYLDRVTNGIGPRLTGSDAFTRACAWAKAEFDAMGVPAHLEQWAEWNVVWNRGSWQGRVVAPEAFELQVATPAWTGATPGRVTAPVVRAPLTVEAVQAAAATLRGRWVITDKQRTRDAVMQAYAAAGVAGVLFTCHASEKHPTRMRVFGDLHTWFWMRHLVYVCIRPDQFARLWALTGGPQPVTAEFEIRNRFRDERIPLHNVVAEIRGHEKPDEFVIVCGHLDSWHQATGATDNGTGVATTMEAARILHAVGARPRRSIRFVLWGGEEQGLYGSLGYVRRHRAEMARMSCALNHDTGTNWAWQLSVTEAQRADMEKVIAPVLTMQAPDADYTGPVFALKTVPKMQTYGSDHATFNAIGVPGFAWGLRGRADYDDYSWHSQWDTYDVAIPEYQRHTATVVALVALGIADLPGLLSREGVVRFKPQADALPIAQARLGVELEHLVVRAVQPDGPAAAAGIRAGDVILAVGTRTVRGAVDLVAAMRDAAGEVAITVRRSGAEVRLRVRPGR